MATWATASPGASPIVPKARPRLSSTPCHSGDSQATGWIAAGRFEIGKNVPENRNSGVIPKRNTALNFSGVRWVAENAAIGAANAMPVRTAAGIPRTISGDAAAPKSAMTIVKIDAMIVSRRAIQTRLPTTMSRGEIGVAYIAWNVFCQVRPPMIGNVASNAADCIVVAARRPGARNWR